jgi:hypothetical protein
VSRKRRFFTPWKSVAGAVPSVIAVANHIKAELAYRSRPERVTVINNAIDPRMFPSRTRPPFTRATRHGL